MPSPGVRVVRSRETSQTTQSPSTANFAVTGWFERGPDNEAVLVTGASDLSRVFGGAVASTRSLAYAALIAYLANGGRRAYVVRTPPSDAITATGAVHARRYAETVETGDGTVGPYTQTADTTDFAVNDGATPLVPSSITLKWRGSGTPVAGARVRDRANSANVDLVNATARYEFRINPTTLFSGGLAVDPDLDAVVSGTAVISWNPDGLGARTPALPSGTGTVTATNGQATRVTLDLRTGIGSVEFAGTDVPGAGVVAASLTIDYTPTTPTYTATDDGSGTFAGSGVTAGTVTYATGAWSLTPTLAAAPYTGCPILATYRHKVFDLSASSTGIWGGSMVSGVARGLRVIVSGDLSGYTAETGTYSLHRVQGYPWASVRRAYDLRETYEGVDLSSATADTWFASLLSGLSDLIVPSDDYGTTGIADLNARSRTLVLAGGDEGSGGRTIQATLPDESLDLHPRGITITYTDSTGTARSITDDGVGGLTGDVDAAYATTFSGVAPNGVDYATRVLNFRTNFAIEGGRVVTITYHLEPESTSLTTNLGDTGEGFTAGVDGTFSSVTYGRNQLTASTLEASNLGVYALNTVDDILHVAVPDLAGDLTATNDLLSWAEGREAQDAGPDRFILLCPPSGYNATRASDWVLNRLQSFSQSGAVYWPWIRMRDPASATGRVITVPPMGHVAGVISRTDSTRGVFKAPAGTQDGALTGLGGYEFTPTKADLDLVADSRINALREGRATGRCVWGARTLSTDKDYKYIAAMRVYQQIARALYNTTFWAVFEDLGPGVYARLTSQAYSYFLGLYGAGYFPGATPAEAFTVQCDGDNNTQDMRDNGQFLLEYGFAFQKPGEFLTHRFSPRRPV